MDTNTDASQSETNGEALAKFRAYIADRERLRAELEAQAQSALREMQATSPTTYVQLFEGNWCTQDSRLVVGDTPRLGGGWNDEARSLTFYGPKDSAVSVFNSDHYRTDDLFAIIIKNDDQPVCVGTFEHAVETTRYSLFFSGGYGHLDGKVTSIRFGQWW